MAAAAFGAASGGGIGAAAGASVFQVSRMISQLPLASCCHTSRYFPVATALPAGSLDCDLRIPVKIEVYASFSKMKIVAFRKKVGAYQDLRLIV